MGTASCFIWENRRDWPWHNKLICKRTYSQISYTNKILSISQSAMLTALFTKESRVCNIPFCDLNVIIL